MMISSYKKTIVLLVVTTVIMTAIIQFVLSPQVRVFATNRKKITKALEGQTSVQVEVEQLKRVKKNEKDVSAKAERINKLWPDSNEISSYIIQTEALASKNNLVLNNITITESTKKEAKTSENKETKADSEAVNTSTSKKGKSEEGIRFSFDASASYDNFKRFVDGMEQLERFNLVSLVNISSSGGDGVTFKISGVIYAK
ncbi:MAG: hypothetical protein WCT32_05175 [Patescibacteria group bacterium]|jgi:Tfp pilus assembly protein PilO